MDPTKTDYQEDGKSDEGGNSPPRKVIIVANEGIENGVAANGADKGMLDLLVLEIRNTRKDTLDKMEEMGKAIEGKVENQLTSLKREIEELKRHHEKEINDLKASLDLAHSEISGLKKSNAELETSNKSAHALLHQQEVRVKRVEDRCDAQEIYSRGFNLRFVGIPEEKDENCVEIIEQLCAKEMGLKVVVENAHRTGKQGNHPRQIIARFLKRTDRRSVLFSSKNLKGSRIFVNEDLIAKDMEKKRSLIPIFKEARKAGKKAFFRGPSLFINNVKYA